MNRDVLWRILALRAIPHSSSNSYPACFPVQSAVRCDGTISDYFTFDTGVLQECVFCQNSVQHLHGPYTVVKSGYGVSFGTVRFTFLDFADDAVIFAKTTEVPTGALDSLTEEGKPLGLRVSWITTKVEAFGDILDAAVETILVKGENVEVTQTFTYIGNVIPSSSSCKQEVNRRLRRA